eukprot:9511491-Heterocapsa_arctica.AAC.1
MAATPAGSDRVRQSAERIGAHVARAPEREDGERSSKRQRIAAEEGSTDDIANPIVNPDDIDDQPDEKKIKGQQPTGTSTAADRKQDWRRQCGWRKPTGTGIAADRKRASKTGTANADGGHDG